MDNTTEQTPEHILSAWYALEVLSPQTFKKPEDLCSDYSQTVSSMAKDGLPWENPRNRPSEDKEIFYHVLLGSLNMQLINELLLKKFSSGYEEKFPTRQQAAIAFITVDGTGCLKNDENLSLSSFAWGYPQALKGNLKKLNEWSYAEGKLRSDVFSIFSDPDSDEKNQVSTDQITEAMNKLAEKLEIPSEHMDRNVYFIQRIRPKLKKPKAFDAKDTDNEKTVYPESPLLNSFYLKDLQKTKTLVAEDPKALGRALNLYIGKVRPDEPIDVLKGFDEIKGLLSFVPKEELEPGIQSKNTPLGRWPITGNNSLILLQQAAVNAAAEELKEEGLMGVNGPPGTGKTTLLRDMVASVIVQRAIAMVKYDDPEEAFTNKGSIKAGQAYITIYDVDKTLKGFEMIVASSNNKAVENITKELPLLNAVNETFADFSYFKTISDKLHEDVGPTWGLMAAVMGNGANQKAFRDVFWHKDLGLQNYLKAASGLDVYFEDVCFKTGQSTVRTPQIVTNENPPCNKSEAIALWVEVRTKFETMLKNTKDLFRIVEKGEDAAQLVSLEGNEDGLIALERQRITNEIGSLEREVKSKKAKLKKTNKEILKLNKNGLMKLCDFTLKVLSFGKKSKQFKTHLSELQDLAAKSQKEIEFLSKNVSLKKEDMEDAAGLLKRARQRLEAAHMHLTRARDLIKHSFADDAYWKQPKNELHNSTPWLCPAIQLCRDELFMTAMEVHKAFIDAAAKPIRHNLMAHSWLARGESMDPALKEYIPSLWTTLFMIVPVVSTTFASVSKMLGDFGPKSIGWLFVDEAGQATPQAAVGAILRSKRVLMVGDPMQIEPVVSQSNNLIKSICHEFKVDPDQWAAPFVSAQSCADRASKYGTWLENDDGSLRIGFPLLVHRRCDNPMFTISNKVAYNGLMIHAFNNSSSKIRDLIGPSKWFHLSGSVQDKWCPEEGELAVKILRTLVNSGILDPDIYFITPFRDVAYKLRMRLSQEKGLFEQMNKEMRPWLFERIGTIHTFQGKEAEAVIMVLGAQGQDQKGARLWAGSKPNLLNVAATRAKNAFYVIGNHSLWANCGTFSMLNKSLTVEGLAANQGRAA